MNEVPAFAGWAAPSIPLYLLLCSLVYKNMGGFPPAEGLFTAEGAGLGGRIHRATGRSLNAPIFRSAAPALEAQTQQKRKPSSEAVQVLTTSD